MSEVLNTHIERTNVRRRLLATASAVVLIGLALISEKAIAEEGDHPTVWIELGGQLNRMENGQEAFAPTLMADRPANFSSSDGLQGPSRYSLDESGKISFEPQGSDWVFSAAVRYGRSSSKRHLHQQTSPGANVIHYTRPAGTQATLNQYPRASQFADTDVQNRESHSVVDFQVGKDVGLGMLGANGGTSVFNLGVRFAQFTGKSSITLKSDPDFRRTYFYVTAPSYGLNHAKFVGGSAYHSNSANLQVARSFRGIGPSLSWNASAPVVGDSQSSELTLDWGLNAAILFGRQRAEIHHQTTGQYRTLAPPFGGGNRHITYQPGQVNITRTRTVTVPNAGAFVGATWRIQNVKASVGYRADFFFGAMDGGIDARKTYDRNFFGPFATISLGLGG